MDKAELLKKVQALASGGIGGERENAQKMLEKLINTKSSGPTIMKGI